jgi:hypothetical protein
VTNPNPSWTQPTAPQPQQKKRSTTKAVLLSVLAVLVLCCGGSWIIGTVTGHDKPGSKTAQPLLVFPSAQAAAPDAVAASVVPATTSAAPAPTPTRTTAAPKKTASPKPKPAPTTRKPTPKPKPTTVSAQSGVRPGAFCAPEGALGTTVKGTLMRCTLKAGEDRARWRKA